MARIDSIKENENLARSIVGRRRWNFDKDYQLLKPLYINDVWKPGKTVRAQCDFSRKNQSKHKNRIHQKCNCGIYALYSWPYKESYEYEGMIDRRSCFRKRQNLSSSRWFQN